MAREARSANRAVPLAAGSVMLAILLCWLSVEGCPGRLAERAQPHALPDDGCSGVTGGSWTGKNLPACRGRRHGLSEGIRFDSFVQPTDYVPELEAAADVCPPTLSSTRWTNSARR